MSQFVLTVDDEELHFLIDGLMVLMHGMAEASPPNDLSEFPVMQRLLERVLFIFPVDETAKRV